MFERLTIDMFQIYKLTIQMYKLFNIFPKTIHK
jgi:hypothetical protein